MSETERKQLEEFAFLHKGKMYYGKFGGGGETSAEQEIKMDVRCFTSNEGSLNYNKINYWQIWAKIEAEELVLKLQDRDGDIFGVIYCPFKTASVAVNVAVRNGTDLNNNTSNYFGFNLVNIIDGINVLVNGIRQYGNYVSSYDLDCSSLNILLEIDAKKEFSNQFVQLGEFYFKSTIAGPSETSKPLFVVSYPIPKY